MKDKVKLFLFKNGMIVYVESPMNLQTIKPGELI